MSIDDYFLSIDRILSTPIIFSTNIIKEKRSSAIGLLYGEIVFLDFSKLIFMEYVELENIVQVKTYSYHFQDSEGDLIFRYDNAPHFPKLKSFPNHKHIHSGTIESNQPDLSQIFIEIQNRMINERK